MTNQIVLTKEIAEEYVAREGEFSYLRWYTEISNDAAQVLAKYPGHLFLDGLTTLSDAAAQALAKFRGAKQTKERSRRKRKNPWNRKGNQAFSKSRGDRTAIELFLAGVLNWEARLRQSFSKTVCRNSLD